MPPLKFKTSLSPPLVYTDLKAPADPKLRRPGRKLSDFEADMPEPVPVTIWDGPKHDPQYENTEGVRDVFAALEDLAPAILAYGGAGVGKSHLIRYLKSQQRGQRQVTVAPTAIAALTSHGQTIHSFFQLPPYILDSYNVEAFKGMPSRLWREMTLLVIDEISMVRPDIIDLIDFRLKELRGDNQPFGGVQVLLVGDPLQLPPVVNSRDMALLNSIGYKTPFFHSANVWHHIDDFRPIKLTKVYRQTEPEFIDALNNIRKNRDLHRAIEFLNDCCLGEHRDGQAPVLLTPTRRQADEHNSAGMAALTGEEVAYTGVSFGKLNVQSESLPVPENLTLKVGAEVMAVVNDAEKRWVNGSRGVVTAVRSFSADVEFYHSGKVHHVNRYSWEKVKQTWNKKTKRIENEVEGSYTQLPLIHGWALTIHKSQGMSLDDVRVDLNGGTFASGQLYVAISRARTLAGLSLSKRLTEADVKVDRSILNFMDWLEEN